MRPWLISSIRHRFQRLSQSPGQVAHVLLTRSPLIQEASSPSSFDLHVLSTPPAFILSQDQTLRKKQMLPPTGIRPAERVRPDQKTNIIADIHKIDPKEFSPGQKTRRG